MKKLTKHLLSILSIILATIFMILDIIDFFPVAWRIWTNKLVFIILFVWLIGALFAIKRLEEK